MGEGTTIEGMPPLQDIPRLPGPRPAPVDVPDIRVTLAELHSRTAFCDLKIYQTVDQLVRTGLFSLGTTETEPALAKS